MKAYLESSFRLAYPVLCDENSVEARMKTAYEPPDGPNYTTAQISAKACVLSMLALKPRLGAPHISSPDDEDLYAAKAHSLLLHIADDESLSTLEATTMLQILCILRTDWHGATFYQSNACRIIFALKGHIDSHPSTMESLGMQGLLDHQNIESLFWISYILDKNISLFTGKPPLLTEAYCDLVQPFNYNPFGGDGSMVFNPTTKSFIEPREHTWRAHFPGEIKLAVEKEKVYQKLFSTQAIKAKNNQLLQHIREMDQNLERWRLSFDEEYRPALFVSDDTLPNADDEDPSSVSCMIRIVALHLEYHHLMTVIHTTVRKCTLVPNEGGPDLHSVVHSSFDISLEASRSTIKCLKYLIERIGEDAFRFVTLYSQVAALTLFLNIIIHPLDARSRKDLELLISTSNMISDMPTTSLTKDELLHVRELSDFVMRLVWLGSCGVTKASREIDQTA
ncbi:hypothetical protein POX_f07872 [Penicillium oxalicum]|uniref:hypothetical protein n=1 Tax=Penicillium oxalicum TaxID=69781 RepID=UPI0020B78A3C|nr:hypothetical protein POX_f07872 [Penicillium oxalicum]KAI2787505.1 hypothetical protein POX_f07872 [Penicillium oxalicum]